LLAQHKVRVNELRVANLQAAGVSPAQCDLGVALT
jgi:hypothetical protein